MVAFSLICLGRGFPLTQFFYFQKKWNRGIEQQQGFLLNCLAWKSTSLPNKDKDILYQSLRKNSHLLERGLAFRSKSWGFLGQAVKPDLGFLQSSGEAKIEGNDGPWTAAFAPLGSKFPAEYSQQKLYLHLQLSMNSYMFWSPGQSTFCNGNSQATSKARALVWPLEMTVEDNQAFRLLQLDWTTCQ